MRALACKEDQRIHREHDRPRAIWLSPQAANLHVTQTILRMREREIAREIAGEWEGGGQYWFMRIDLRQAFDRARHSVLIIAFFPSPPILRLSTLPCKKYLSAISNLRCTALRVISRSERTEDQTGQPP